MGNRKVNTEIIAQKIADRCRARTVLLVDDDLGCRSVMRQCLEKLGWNVTEADSGERAMERLQSETSQPDAAMIDLLMPGIGGLPVAKWIRDMMPNVHVIISSGADVEALGAISESFTIMPKPVKFEEVKKMFEKFWRK